MPNGPKVNRRIGASGCTEKYINIHFDPFRTMCPRASHKKVAGEAESITEPSYELEEGCICLIRDDTAASKGQSLKDLNPALWPEPDFVETTGNGVILYVFIRP